MTELLIRLFVKDRDNTADPAVRTRYGTLSGAVGIILNTLISVIKLIVGTLSGSIAIVSDGFNNLSDAGSSVLNLLGFRLASKKPNPNHPFGHGRIEYLTGLAISAVIVVLGVELFRSSVEKIRHPGVFSADWITVAVLLFSILVKVFIVFFNRKIGKRIRSESILTVAKDSLMDIISTTAVLLSVLVSSLTSLNIDGWCGVLVSLLILYVGITAALDTLSPLLGKAPEPELVRQIEELVMAHPEIVGIHDLIVHDYGPGRMMISLHTEVPADGDILELHDAIDNIERELSETMHCHATIHLDPICTDEETKELRHDVGNICSALYEGASIHDFRMVKGPTHTNILFDMVLPYSVKETDGQVKETVSSAVRAKYENTFVIMEIDRSYV